MRLAEGSRGELLLTLTAPWAAALLRSGIPPAPLRRGENFQRLSSSASPQYMPAHGDVFSARLCVAGSIPLGCVEPV